MAKRISSLLLIVFASVSVFTQNRQGQLEEYLRNFQYQQALEYIDTQEPTKELFVQKALCYKSLNDFHSAINILLPLSQEYSGDIQIKAELAQCYEAISHFQSGIKCYNEIIKLDSANLYFKTKKADLLANISNYKEAIGLYMEVLKEKPLPSIIKRTARCYDNMNMPDSAISFYSKAWAMDSTDSYAVANLTNLFLKSKHYGNAIQVSDLYLRKDSADKQINLLNALAYYGLDLYEEAAERFGRCYAAGDTSLIVNRALGISYYSLGKSEQAIPHLENAYRMDTLNNNVLYCLGVTYNDTYNYEKAIDPFTKLLDRTIPGNMTLYLYYRGLAIAYDQSEHPREGVENYRKALQYANEKQKMDILFPLANLMNYDLDDREGSLGYYKLYREELITYITRLKEKENEDNKKRLADAERKLDNLDSFIENMEKVLTKIKKDKSQINKN